MTIGFELWPVGDCQTDKQRQNGVKTTSFTFNEKVRFNFLQGTPFLLWAQFLTRHPEKRFTLTYMACERLVQHFLFWVLLNMFLTWKRLKSQLIVHCLRSIYPKTSLKKTKKKKKGWNVEKTTPRYNTTILLWITITTSFDTLLLLWDCDAWRRMKKPKEPLVLCFPLPPFSSPVPFICSVC